MDNVLKVIPDLIFIVYAGISMLIVAGIRYKLKISIISSILTFSFVIALNLLLTIFFDNFLIEDWFLLTSFLPLAILTWVLGKRRSVSLVAAILNAFLGAYSAVLLKDIILTTIERPELEYVVFFFTFPIILLYLIKIYIPLHNEIEKFSQNRIGILIMYAVFLILEFYFYGVLIRESTMHVLRIEIFGIAILSVYFISIIILYIIIKTNNDAIYQEANNKILKRNIEHIKEQAKISEEKNEKLKIIRHDMRHVLYNLSSLIQNENNDEALKLISSYINEIELTKDLKFTTDTFINATLEYYYHICQRENIKLNININDIEDKINVSSTELSVVISNALENAFKATKELVDHREINFTFINNNDRLILSVENYYDGEVKINKDGTPISDKEGHGIGSQSILAFAKRNNLVINYDITKNKFRLTILF